MYPIFECGPATLTALNDLISLSTETNGLLEQQIMVFNTFMNDLFTGLEQILTGVTEIRDNTYNTAANTFLTQSKVYANSVTSPGNAFKVLGI